MLLVVLPFTDREVPLVLKNLALVKKMDGVLQNRILMTYEEGTQRVAEVKKAVLEVFPNSFYHVYHRGPSGWPSGPNHAFKCTAWHIGELMKKEKTKESWLWWEADAVPLCKGWLEILNAAHVAGGRPFSGHVVGGMEHMNGVGIYPPDVREFSIRAMTSINTPWDVNMKADTQAITHPINHLILHYWNIHEGKNFNGPSGVPLTVSNRKELSHWTTPESVLLHRCKDGSVADVLLQDENQKTADEPIAAAAPVSDVAPAVARKKRPYRRRQKAPVGAKLPPDGGGDAQRVAGKLPEPARIGGEDSGAD